MKPVVVVVVTCAVLASCMEPLSPLPRPSAPTPADFSEREECLYRTACKMIGERGTSPTVLDSIAVSATGICSASLHEKMIAHYGPELGTDLMEQDKMETERDALAIAMEQTKPCASHP